MNTAGDVVCTGWLIKSPPEKKLKRFAWRKRWFVLRRGRMSGNPDVLEYYQSKNSKKPIRTIDLRECQVEMLNGQLGIKRDFQEKHLFVVKTSARMFYLVAKTEEEMNSWIRSISRICHFGNQEDAGSLEEGFPHTPTSLQPSSDTSDQVSSHPPDYLILSQCGTGSESICRHGSLSNSESCLKQKATEDIVPSPPCSDSSSLHCISQFRLSPSPIRHGRPANPPLSAPCTAAPSSSSPLHLCAMSVFQFDRPYSCASFEAANDGQTPPPLPPKPNHLSDGGIRRPRAMSARHFPKHLALLSRRTSLSSLDHFTIGDADNRSSGNRRQTLHLQSYINTTWVQHQEEDSYIPMLSPSEGDGYIPMNPVSVPETKGKGKVTKTLSPLCQAGECGPPPIHRHLKPCLRRARPPPLDLRGLSTITECPAHHSFNRTKTELCFSFPGKGVPHEESLGNEGNPGDEDPYGPTTESRQHVDGAVQHWARKSNLDYLSLDFNSASPSPVQKKPLLFDEDRVDYVLVDEKKTQALQNTKMEWTDVRQSKTMVEQSQ
ncbi:GRB2-associated-binding protein 3 isoform X2 [Corythoichthys intestinalis]|uniref:GRB2-associated-binding protein 3 isoform X2 n=1 Tax=Corythoichthys intestinalis TaxID=161448 RepID=UPI0025A4E747|nr:GRB2-associated-binding protein 3 isoform X2 [Corythoichthys intestinalis]